MRLHANVEKRERDVIKKGVRIEVRNVRAVLL